MPFYSFFRLERNKHKNWKGGKGAPRWVKCGPEICCEELTREQMKKRILNEMKKGTIEPGRWRVQRRDEWVDGMKTISRFTESVPFHVRSDEAWL